jgi:hypothetical protein
MAKNSRTRRRGSSLIEFTFVGIPLICILITTFELSRGMWAYETLAYAVKSGVRYAIVHGQNCSKSPNTCTVTVGQIAGKIRSTGVGLPPDLVTLRFRDAAGTDTTCSLTDCIANYNSSAWPPSSANAPGQDVRISGAFEFRSAMLMFWPGAGRPVGTPGVFRLTADSREGIQY